MSVNEIPETETEWYPFQEEFKKGALAPHRLYGFTASWDAVY
jgi:hypothetical protein